MILQVSVSATKRKLFADNLNPQSIINDSNKHMTVLKEAVNAEVSGKYLFAVPVYNYLGLFICE